MTEDAQRHDSKPGNRPPREPVPSAASQQGEGLPDGLSGAVLPSARTLKRFSVALIGGTVLLIGIAMILLPGPALIVIPAGLAILATEFLWARRALRQCKGAVVQVRRKSPLRRFRWRRRAAAESADFPEDKN